MKPFVYNSGWQAIKSIFVYNSGWKNVKSGWVYNGGWKQFFGAGASIQYPVNISQSTSSSTYLVTLTGTNYYWSPAPTSLTYAFQWSTDGSSWTTISSGTATNPSSGSSNTYTYTVPSSYVSPNTLNYYQFVVTATISGSGTTTSTSGTTTIQGPTDISVTASLSGQTATLNWTSSTGANRYIVYYYRVNTGTYYYAQNGGGGYSAGSNSATITGLYTGSSYIFYVLPITGYTGTNLSNYTGYPGDLASNAGATALSAPNTPVIGYDPNHTTYTNIRFYFYAVTDTNHNAAVGYYWKSGPTSSYSTTGYTYDSINGWYYVDQPVISGCPSGYATFYVYAYNYDANGYEMDSGVASLTQYANSLSVPSTPTITTSSTSSSWTITATFGSNTTAVGINYGGYSGSYPTYLGSITTSGGSLTPVGPFSASTTYYWQATPANGGCFGSPVTGSVTTLPLAAYTPTFSYYYGSSSSQGYIYISSSNANSISYTVYRTATGTNTSGYGTGSYSVYATGTISGNAGYYYLPVNGYYYIYATATNAGGSNSAFSSTYPQNWFYGVPTYTVTFSDGIDSASGSSSTTAGSYVVLPSPSAVTNYTFNGWYTGSGGTGFYVGGGGSLYYPGSSGTVYAYWTYTPPAGVAPSAPSVSGDNSIYPHGGHFYWSSSGTSPIGYVFSIYSPSSGTVYSTYGSTSSATSFAVGSGYYTTAGNYTIYIYASNAYGSSSTTVFSQYMS
jgi:hypothetical protein